MILAQKQNKETQIYCTGTKFMSKGFTAGQLIFPHDGLITKHKLNIRMPNKPVESKTRTYHGRVGSGRPAERPGGVGQDWVPTELFAKETKVQRTFQRIEDTTLQRLSRSTNKRNPM